MFKKFLCVFMTFCLTLSLATSFVYASTTATKHIDSPSIVVKGHIDNATNNELISIKAMLADEIAHVGITTCDSYGDYTYKFTVDGDADNLSLKVQQGGEDATDTVVSVIEEGGMYDVDLTILNAQGKPFHAGIDTECVLKASIDNLYGGEDTYVLFVAFYDAEGRFLKTEIKDDCVMSFAKDGGLQSETFVVNSVPEDMKTAKGFIFKSARDITPLAVNAEYDDEKAYGLNNINNEPGDLVLAYLGGSITAGTGTTDLPLRYSTRVTNYFREKYPQKNVIEHNAGIGGTGSITGLVRLEKDIISANPDVVFIEFAVNDQNPDEAIRLQRSGYYEDIIRSLINLPKQPVIIMLYSPSYHTGYPSTGGDSDKGNAGYVQEQLAQHYGIGSVDFDSYVGSLYQAGIWTDWRANFPDGTHPNDATYEEYANYIIDCFEADADKYFCKIATDTERLRPESGYTSPELIPYTSDRISYTGDWKRIEYANKQIYPDGYWQAPANGGTFTFTFKGTTFGIFGMYSPYNMAGATYDIDGGKYIGEIELTKRPEYVEYILETKEYLLLNNLEDCEHTVTVTTNPVTTERPYPMSFGWLIAEEK